MQVIVGTRPRFKANYKFRFNPAMRVRLEATRDGWLALALAEQEFFLLIPWAEARGFVGRPHGDRHHLYVPVDRRGRASTFAPYTKPL